MTAAPAKTIAVSTIANRRQFLFAPIIISQIHALIYAPPAPPTHVLRSWFLPNLVLLVISHRRNSATAKG